MSECEELLRELDGYLDGELPADERKRVEAHLTECGPCFRRHGFVRSLRDLIRRKCAGAERMPEDLAERIRAAIRTSD